MRTSIVTTLSMVCTLFGGALSTANAQNANNGLARIAIIDVAYIFKNATPIKEEVARVEQSLKELQQQQQAKQQEMIKESQLLRTFKPGTADYVKQEEKLAKLETDIKLELVRRRKALAEAEANLYYTNYQKIKKIVTQVAEFNKIDLVLRYDSEAMDLEKPNSVLRGVMKTVVYRSPKLDLTKMVLQAVNKVQVAQRK